MRYTVYRLLSLSLALVSALAWTAPAFAAQPVNLNIRGVQIDITSDSATSARNQAMQTVTSIALQRLLDKYVPKALHPNMLKDLSADDVIEGVDIESEKFSGVRYIGVFGIQLNPYKVGQIFKHYHLNLPNYKPLSLLVVPVLHGPTASLTTATNPSPSRALLWEETNVWRQVWDQNSYKNEFHRIHLPLGDLEDQLTIPEINPEGTPRADAVLALRKRYHVDRVYAVHAFATPDAPSADAALTQTPRALTISKVSLQDLATGALTSVSLPDSPTSPAAISSLIRPTLDVLEMLDPIYPETELSSVLVYVSPRTLEDWERIKNQLRINPMITALYEESITTQRCVLRLSYRGSRTNLQKNFQDKDLQLLVHDGYFHIQMRPERVQSPTNEHQDS